MQSSIFAQQIRQEMKKKRFILDATRPMFGCQSITSLKSNPLSSMPVSELMTFEGDIKAFPLKGTINFHGKPINLGIKLVPFETCYNKAEHPSLVEFLVLKYLTDNFVLKGVTPHIVNYIHSQKVANNSDSIKKYKLNLVKKLHNYSHILISEFVEGHTLKDLDTKDLYTWKAIVFQVIYTLYVFQRNCMLMHNDLHYKNIIIDTREYPHTHYVYTIGNKTFYIENRNACPKLWDFEFAMIYSTHVNGIYPNRYVVADRDVTSSKSKLHVGEYSDTDSETSYLHEYTRSFLDDRSAPYNYNEVYDLHRFLYSIYRLDIPKELFDWIESVYPEDLVVSEYDTTDTEETQMSLVSLVSLGSSEVRSRRRCTFKGRILNGVETRLKDQIPTPIDLLKHSFFDEFLVKPTNLDKSLYFFSDKV